MLSKWLNAEPKLLILDEPTRGIDVGAKAEVHHMISDLASQGIAVIMISSDLPEVLAMSDRVLVMREGRQMALLDRAEATEESVMAAAMGTLIPGAPCVATLRRRTKNGRPNNEQLSSAASGPSNSGSSSCSRSCSS